MKVSRRQVSCYRELMEKFLLEDAMLVVWVLGSDGRSSLDYKTLVELTNATVLHILVEISP